MELSARKKQILKRVIEDYIALTGPIERGDAQTVSKHLQEIRKFAAESTVGQDILTAYTALSKQLIRIAQQKHPHKDYKHLEKELEQ